MLIEFPAPQLIELSGPDAVAFAHAQFASDVRALAQGHWQWSAWLSAQGRVRAWFALLRPGPDRLLMILRGGDAAAMRTALSRYVLRAKVTLRVASELRLFGATDADVPEPTGAAPEANRLVAHDETFALRWPDGERRLLLMEHLSVPIDAASGAAALARWHLADMRAGLPLLAPSLEDQLLPQWLGLERLGAISVGKGCYPGQEIMARLHFKGGNKRSLYRIALHTMALPPAGTGLRSGDAEAGTLVEAEWTDPPNAEALAVLTDAAASGPLHAGGASGEFQVVSRFA